MLRRTIRFMMGMLAFTLAITVVACNTSSMTESSVAAPAADPIVNQAVVYGNHAHGASLKGPGKNGGLIGGLVDGVIDEVSCLLPDSLVLDVGPKGASFSANGNSIVFPKNALSQTVHIVMIPQLGGTMAAQFYPEGLVFNPDAMPTLTLSTDCIGDPATAHIVYTDMLGTVLEQEKTKSKDGHSVTAYIPHFSRYAVAW